MVECVKRKFCFVMMDFEKFLSIKGMNMFCFSRSNISFLHYYFIVLHCSLLIFLSRSKQGGGVDIYLRKDVYYVFVFGYSKLRKLSKLAKSKATVDVYGLCYIPLCTFNLQKVYFVVIHIGVGYLGVARTGELGNAKALSSGTSNRYRFPRFFFLYGVILIYLL